MDSVLWQIQHKKPKKHTDDELIMWLRKKHKIGYRKAVEKLNSIRQANPELFYHWKMGYC